VAECTGRGTRRSRHSRVQLHIERDTLGVLFSADAIRRRQAYLTTSSSRRRPCARTAHNMVGVGTIGRNCSLETKGYTFKSHHNREVRIKATRTERSRRIASISAYWELEGRSLRGPRGQYARVGAARAIAAKCLTRTETRGKGRQSGAVLSYSV